MGIGTSLGAFFDDAFHHEAGIEAPPEVVEPAETNDNNTVTPGKVEEDKKNEQQDLTDPNLGGVPISLKRVIITGHDDPKDYTNEYNTPLSDSEQADYNTKFKPQDSYDYDMQGWYKANPGADPNAEGVHYPDTFKKPNHPTFSDQSQYSGDNGFQGGTWGSEDGKDTFTPGPTNLMMHGEDLRDYFSKVEPNVSLRMPAGASTELAGALKSTEGTDPPARSIIDKLTGMDGGERYQLWPERMIRSGFTAAHDAMTGQIPGWAMDQDTGEFHTSPEMIERAGDMAGLVMTGAMPGHIHLQGPVRDALNAEAGGPEAEGTQSVQDLQRMISNIRRNYTGISDEQIGVQPRTTRNTSAALQHYNDVEHISDTLETLRQSQSPSDYHYDAENVSRRMQSSDPTERAIASIEEALYGPNSVRHFNPRTAPAPHSTIEAQPLTEDQVMAESERRSRLQDVADKVAEARNSDKLKLIDNGKMDLYGGTSHAFVFANKAGKGRLNITESNNGKELYVNGIFGDKGPWQYDTKTIKGLVNSLKEKFPQAEILSGFRVSGARVKSGSGSNDASMRLKPKVK